MSEQPTDVAIGDTFARAGEHARWAWEVTRAPLGVGGCYFLTRGRQDLLTRGDELLDPKRWRRVRAL
jgi:hypothetical protein